MDTIADYNDWKSKRQQNGIGAASVILGSVNDAPDELAGDLNLASEFSKTTGNPVPPAPMVKEYRNVFQQAIEREKNKTILSQSPRLTDWLRNPDNAALSRDDLPGLSWFEGFGRGAVATGQRAVERLSQMGNQAMLEQTAGRARDRGKTFGDILKDERTSAGIKDMQGNPIETFTGTEYLSAFARWADARFADMIGTDDEAAAKGFAANIKAAQDAIAATPKSEIATSFEKQAMAPGASFGQSISNIGSAFINNPVGGLSWALETAGESIPQIAAAIGVTAATRNPAAGIGVLGGGSYLTERYTAPADFLAEKGIDLGNPLDVQRVISDPKILEDAANRGVIRGAIIGAFDLASGGLAGRALAGNPFVEAFAQMAQQAILGSAGEYSARVAAGQPVDWNDVLAEGLAEIATAPVDMGVAGREFTINRRKSEDVENRRVMFEQLSGQAGASALRNRMPDKFREFVAAATANGPVENVFVPAEQFSTYFQGIGVDPYALVDDLDGVTRDDLDAALAGGSDLKIPTATYAAKIAGSEHDAFLMENMRFDPDQFTAAEAAEFNARAEDAMQEALEHAEQLRLHEESLRSFEQEIYDTMVSRLRAAGRSTDVATTEAMLYPAFYRTMAERSGLTVDEFMAKYPLPQVEGERPEGMQAKDVDALTRTLAEARSRRAVGLDKRQSLLEFISDYGGINDVSGELRSRDAEVVKRGRKNLKLARKGVVAGVRDMLGSDGGKKHGFDDVAQAAIEAGFLANDPVVVEYQNAIREGRQVPDIGRALMAAIDRELGGTMEFSSVQAVDQNTADNEAMLDQIEAYLNRIGVGLDDSDEAIRAAVQADQESEGRKYGQVSALSDVEAMAASAGVDLSVSERGGLITLHKIVVGERGQGSGTRIMTALTAYADAHGKMIVLTPSTDFGATSVERLREFYKRFGFVDNKGRNRDFSTREAMLRPAVGPRLFQSGDVTKTEAFKRWFGNSKVVDDQGRPLVVYHGTSTDIDGQFAFDPRFIGSTGSAEGYGFYFTTDVNTADGYRGRDGGSLAEVYLSMQKPMPVDQKGFSVSQVGKIIDLMIDDEISKGDTDTYKDTFISNYVDTYSTSRAAAVREVARIIAGSGDSAIDQIAELGNSSGDKVAAHAAVRDVTGFDGIVSDGYGGRGEAGGTIYVAWFPEQIKSVNNRGTFDWNDPRILFQSGDVRGARGSIRFPAAGVGNGDAVISLFQSADLSTFLHESGHYFLTVMQDLASRGEPNADADFAAVKSWWRENAADVAKDGMRVMPDVTLTPDDVTAAIDTGSTGDVLKDAAIDVGMQEQWARAFETYLMEGKSPNVELRSAFEKFRAWLISVYQKLAGLNVNVSDELRRVFDRMLASDDEISSAQTNSGGADPVFPTAEAMGLTQEEYDRFLKLRSQAEDDAKARLLREVMAPIKRERDKWFRDERAKVRDEVERNVNALPAYRAIEWMGNRRWWGDEKPESLPDIRLSKDILVDRYGEGVLKTLPRGKQTVYAVEGGIDPDDAAGWFGFDSGDELVKAMERSPRRVDAIEAETDKEMRDRHGDVLLDGTAEAQALDAVHNDKRGQWIAAELKAIAEVAGVDVGMTAKEARHTARQTISRMRVRDAMAANRFLSAERKAGEEAARLGAMLAREGVWLNNARRRVAVKARAAMRGDGTVDAVPVQIEAANRSTGNYNETVTRLIEVKRRQLLNHALFMEARAVTDEVEKAERFVAKLGKRSTREKIAGAGRREDAGIDYLAAIDEIMERYDFRRMSGTAEQRRGALAAFVEAMKATGRENELAIPDTVLAAAARAPYKTIPVEELRGVVASLKNLEHVALRWNKLIDAQRERDLDQAVTAVTDAFEANVKKRPPSRVASKGEAARNSVRQFLDLVLNATTLLREIDGFEDRGGAYQNIKAPIDDAMNRLITRKERAAKDIEALYSVYSKDERRAMAVREHMPALGYGLSKWERIAVALNTGNAGNRQRLSDPKVRGSLTDDQIEAVLSTLDERDAKFVQSVWDYIGSFRDDIAARERRTTGNEPDWVEPSPVTIAGKVLKGGYYPIKYDPRLSSLARDDQANEIWQSMQAGRFGKAQTRSGHLKERAQSSGRAVEFDMSVMHRHINQVVYDLELSEAVSNSWRVLQDGRVRSAFMESGKQADFEALEAWLLDVGQGELRSADFVGRASRTLKSNFTAAKLAFNLSTVAMQVTGLAQSMVVVGKKNMVVGIRDAMRSGISNEIASKSPYMSTRQTTFNKDIYDFYNDPKTGPVASKWGEIKSEVVGPLAFWLMTKVQWYLVDVPTWLAGYQQGLRKFGNDEAAAISHADDIVKRAQASGLFPDRSAVERGSVSRTARQNDVVRLFTALGSYMFAKFNVAYERTRKASRTISAEGVSTRSAQEALSWTLDMAFLFTLEAVLTAAIKGRLPGGDDDDDDDWMTFLARETGFSIMGTVPFVRDAASSLQGFNGGGAYGAVMDEFAKPFKQASQGEVDAALVKSVISATGLATGLPATQINRAVDAAWRQAEGKDVSPVEFLLGRR